MEIIAKKGNILETEADMIVVGMFEAEDTKNPFLQKVSDYLGKNLNKEIKAQNFEGKVGQRLVFTAQNGTTKFLMMCGMGPENQPSLEVPREVSALAVQTAKKLGVKTIAIEFIGEDRDDFNARTTAEAIAEGALLADYSFAIYKKKKNGFDIHSLTIVAEDGRDARRADKGIETAYEIYAGVKLARDLVNTPAKDMTPQALVIQAQTIAKESNGLIKTRIYDREQCERKKMNAFLSVADGSYQEPAFIHLIYTPEKPKNTSIALVGKGVTFDSGGLSLKPGNSMETMKCDMAGAAAVMGAFQTLASLNPKVVVHGIIAATENMPSGRSTRPGDIVRASNGETIEILNTDAEGRLTLADALTYAGKQNTTYIVDLATLTGACVVALGEEVNGLMANDDDLAEKILETSKTTGEKLWRLPLEPSYMKLIESEIADVRNISTTRYGGTLTAGLFLSHFVPEDAKWAHIDIAGPAFAERPINSYTQKGGTGAGVRTLIQLIKSI